jgi:hypothetical protein
MLKPFRRRPTPANFGLDMTICIAAKSRRDESIVAICDKMLSYDDLVPATEGAAEKALWVHRHWYAMMADDPTLAIPIIRRVQKHLEDESTGRLSSLEEMTSAFRAAFQEQLQQEVEDRFLRVYGMNLTAFKRDGFQTFGAQEFSRLNSVIASFNLPIQFLVFGIGSDRFGHIFEVNSSTGALIAEQDVTGYTAIGSGQYMAMGSLAARPLPKLSVDHLIYRLCEGKFAAETAHGVGKETALMVLYRNGSFGMVPPSLIDTLRGFWEKERKAEVPEDATEVIKKVLREVP